MRIVIAVTNDIVTDQRVARACSALCEDGHEVLLVGRHLPGSPDIHRQYETCRMRLLFKKNVWFYAEYNMRLLLKLLFLRADMFYANDADTLPAAAIAARLRGKPLFFDAHEIFHEVPELVGKPHVKRFWQRIERLFIPWADGSATVCQSIADYYKQQLGVDMAVVRNVPPRASNPIGACKAQPPVILYQGAVNVGRGIDRIIDAMEFLPDYRFVVAGVGDEYELMRRYASVKPWSSRIEFLGRVEPERLRQLTPTASLGVCLLDDMGLNYYYSLPNRLGDFIAAQVPLLATDFPEIRRVIARYDIGTLAHDERDETLAKLIDDTVERWNAMPADQRRDRMQRAATDLCWDNDKKVLLDAVNKIIAANKR